MSKPEVFHKAAVDETQPDTQAIGERMEVPPVQHGLWGTVEAAATSVC